MRAQALNETIPAHIEDLLDREERRRNPLPMVRPKPVQTSLEPDLEDIMDCDFVGEIVRREFRVSWTSILAYDRRPEMVAARQFAAWVLHRAGPYNLVDTGRIMARDHTSIIKMIRKADCEDFFPLKKAVAKQVINAALRQARKDASNGR